MSKVHTIQTSFNAGIYSIELDGHVDAPRRDAAVEELQNMLPRTQGEATRRGGTKFVKEIKTSANRTHLVPFEFNTTQAYIIEFGDLYVRFYKDNGAILESTTTISGATQANPVVITDTGHPYSDGDEIYIDSVGGMTELNGKYYLVANSAANTYELTDVDGNNIDGTGYTAYTSGGTSARVYTVTTPYAQADLFDSDGVFRIKWAQSADVLYLVHPDYEPRALTRTAHTSWTLTQLTFNDGPYLATNTTSTTLALSGTSGSVTVTASATTGINGGSGFATTDVGRIIRWKDPAGNWTWLTITAHTDTKNVTATISGPNASAGTATTSWRMGLYSDTDGHPQAVGFFEDRIVFGGSDATVNRVDFSETGGFSPTETFFAPSDPDGTVNDDNAIAAPLNSGKVNSVHWMSPDEKGMAVGTAGSEWLIRASINGEALTPSNAKAVRSTVIGSSNQPSVSAGNATLFVQRLSERLHEYAYNFEADGFRSPDMTVFVPSLTTGGVTSVDYQQIPNNNLWAVRDDGTLLGFLYERFQGVTGWSKHIVGGTFSSGQAVVESVAVIPAPDLKSDEVWMIVKRTINSATRRYVEYMTSIYDSNKMDKEDAFHVDCGLSLDTPITISGATQADPVVITATGHNLTDGDVVRIDDVVGMTELNGNRYKIANSTANTFELTNENTSANIDGTGFTAYVSDGEVRLTVASVSGLDHLEGETVKLLVDGKSHPDKTVASGAITLSGGVTGARIHVGLQNTWRLKTLRPEAGSDDGTAQGKIKRIDGITVRLRNSLGVQYGPDDDNLDEYDFDYGTALSSATPLYTGDTEYKPFPGGYNNEGQVLLTDDGPFPVTVQAIITKMTVQDR